VARTTFASKAKRCRDRKAKRAADQAKVKEDIPEVKKRPKGSAFTKPKEKVGG
jgi:hypothetical protein